MNGGERKADFIRRKSRDAETIRCPAMNSLISCNIKNHGYFKVPKKFHVPGTEKYNYFRVNGTVIKKQQRTTEKTKRMYAALPKKGILNILRETDTGSKNDYYLIQNGTITSITKSKYVDYLSGKIKL